MSESKRPLSVRGLYEILRDPRRGRLVLPHTVLPYVGDLLLMLEQLFDAVGAVTSDRRWSEAAEVLERARELLHRPMPSAKPLERPASRFAGVRTHAVRKGMVMVRSAGRFEPRPLSRLDRLVPRGWPGARRD